jgi:hypothetical protein
MRATREAAEVPSTAKNGGTNDAVAAGESHVLSSGRGACDYRAHIGMA